MKVNDEIFYEMPLLHRMAYRWAWYGLRSPQLVWKFVSILKSRPKEAKVLTPNGFPLFHQDSDYIANAIYLGTFERPLLKFLNSLSLQNLIIDVGANIGVTLWHSLKHANLTASFVAFEPSLQCINQLTSITSMLTVPGKIICSALGAADSQEMIFGLNNPNHSGAASLATKLGHDASVIEVNKLDTIAPNLLSNNTIISLLKIDVEGYEPQVIQGAKVTLKSHKPEIIVLEVSPSLGFPEHLNELHKIIGSQYKWFVISEIGFLRKRAALKSIELNDALLMEEQWNLAVLRNDILENYMNNPQRIKLL